MNYLAEVLAFNNWIEYNSTVNKSDICLWHALMHMANRFGWKEFNAPIAMLILKTKLNRDAIYRARNKLKQLGLIDFKERGGNQCAMYRLQSVVSQYGMQSATQNATQNATQSTTQTTTQNATIHKTKNQKLKTRKEIDKEKHGEFKNVLLHQDELAKLQARFFDCDEKIERLSRYLESSGKKYASHYATILNWSASAKETDQNPKTSQSTASYDLDEYEKYNIFDEGNVKKWK